MSKVFVKKAFRLIDVAECMHEDDMLEMCSYLSDYQVEVSVYRLLQPGSIAANMAMDFIAGLSDSQEIFEKIKNKKIIEE